MLCWLRIEQPSHSCLLIITKRSITIFVGRQIELTYNQCVHAIIVAKVDESVQVVILSYLEVVDKENLLVTCRLQPSKVNFLVRRLYETFAQSFKLTSVEDASVAI